MNETIRASKDKQGKVERLKSHEAAMELGYQEMAEDEERELEALEWAEATIGDVSDEPR